MSPLSTKPRLRAYLGEQGLALCLHAPGRRGRLLREALLPLAAGEAPWPALQAWWQATGSALVAGPVRLELVLGLPHVRYLLLPWSPDLVDAAARRSLARLLHARQFGDTGAPPELALGPLRFGQPQLVAAVDRDLLSGARSFAAQQGWQLAAVEPLLSAVWNEAAPRLREDGPLLVAEAGRCLVVRREKGCVVALQVRPADGRDVGTEIERLAAQPGLRVFAPLQAAPGGPVGSALAMAGAGEAAFARAGAGATRRLDLDFVATSRRRPLALAVLLIALVGVGAALLQRADLMDRIAAESSALARLERTLSRQALVQAAALPADPRALAQARELAASLQRPWGEMLDAVQAAARPDIVITRLQPASAPGELLISGQAASSAAFLGFVERLRAQPRWQQVLPVSQELAEDAPGLPLSFQLRLAGGTP